MRSEMLRAQDIQAEQADKHRQGGTELKIADRVWMDAKNIIIQKPSKKLHLKCIRPYKITEVISPWAYRSLLPKNLNIHLVQPISHLSKVLKDPLPGQIQAAPPPVIVDGEEEYEVERVDDSWIFRWQLQYLVNWKSYDECSWEPTINVDRLNAIDDFHAEQPGKPGSTTS
jgi:hypothetical protein